MLKIYIKNHIKMILRKKWLLVLMILFPLLLTLALSSVFGDLMNREVVLEPITIGYDISENTTFPVTALEEVFQENKVTLVKQDKEDYQKLMEKEEIVAYLEITETGYTLYKTTSYEKELIAVEGICYSFFQQYQLRNSEPVETNIETIPLPIAPLPSAIDYYGIIEVVYFTWFGFMALTSILSNERKNSILNRIRVSSATSVTLFLGKFIPVVCICFMEMVVVMALSTILLDVHWGNLLISLFLILVSIMATTAFSLLVFALCKQVILGVAILYFAGFVAGFIGGTFQMYMFAPFTESVKSFSPIYHTNRALVELGTQGSSSYVSSAILFLLAIAVVCTALALLRMNRKEELV